MLRSIYAEILKLRGTLALWTIFIVGFLIAGFIFFGHMIDVHSLSEINIDPWERYYNRGAVILSLLSIAPFAIILVSAVQYIEHSANAWKYLYTTPASRISIYFSKLIVILSLFLAGIFLYILFITFSAYVLHLFHPEYELIYHDPDLWVMSKLAIHFMLATLGVIGIQYFVSRQFKNILIPAAIGIFSFIASLLIAIIDTTIAKFIPFTYPILCQDLNTFTHSYRVFYLNDSISNYEIYSIAVFLVFITAGAIIEHRKKVV